MYECIQVPGWCPEVEKRTEEIPLIRISDTSPTWGQLFPGGRFDSFLSLHYVFHCNADMKVYCVLYTVLVGSLHLMPVFGSVSLFTGILVHNTE